MLRIRNIWPRSRVGPPGGPRRVYHRAPGRDSRHSGSPLIYTALFFAQGALHALLFVWLLRLWHRFRPPAALVLLLPELGLVYDNLIIASGRSIGLGPLLAALSWPRFWLHWVCGPWPIIAAGSILRSAGLPCAQSRIVMGAFCALSVALTGLDMHLFGTAVLHPVCEHGLLRESLSVSAGHFCFPGETPAPGSSPTASIVTCAVVIVTGAVLWIRRGFPWMCAGGVAMLAASAPLLRPLRLDNLGEVLILGGLVFGIARFAPARHSALASRSASSSTRCAL
jgi:hypothetical protein